MSNGQDDKKTQPPERPADAPTAFESVDYTKDEPVTSAASRGAEDQTFWQKVWQPNISDKQAATFWSTHFYNETPEELKAEETKATAEGKGFEASKAAFKGGTAESLGRVTAPLTSAGQIVLAPLTEGAAVLGPLLEGVPYAKYLAPLLKVPGRAVGAWFGMQGLHQAFTSQQPGESGPDALERRLLGASAVAGEAASVGGDIREFAGHFLVNAFGLDPEMAGKVAERVDRLRAARKERDESLQAIETTRDALTSTMKYLDKRRVAALQTQLEADLEAVRGRTEAQFQGIDSLARQGIEASKGRIPEMNRQTLAEGARIMSDTARVTMELEGERQGAIEGKLSIPFREIGEKITEPIMPADDVRSLILDRFKKRGIQAQELPGGAIRALPTGGEEFVDKGPTLEEEGGLDYIDVGEGPEVKFNDLTRIREDLIKTARAWEKKDKNVAGALTDAYDWLTDRQQGAADQHGLGEKYRKAKLAYSQHFRGLGSGLMKDWLNAENVKNQDMAAKVSKLIASDDINTKGATARAIRQTLKAAGIDTTAFDDLVNSTAAERTVPKRIEEAAKEGKKVATERGKAETIQLKRGTEEKIKRITGEPLAEGEVQRGQKVAEEAAQKQTEAEREKFKKMEREIERPGQEVIPGYGAEELAGKNLEELYRTKLQQVARSQNANLALPFVMMTYGLLHASLFPFSYGLTRASIPQMLRNPKFQDWIIDQTGVSPRSPQANRMRRAINQLGPTMVRLYNTGIPQAAVVQGMPPKRQSSEPPTREDLEQ